MVGPFGNAFLRDIRHANRAIFFWTVNEVEWMKWSIYKEVDGIITDDPKKYLEVCKEYKGEPLQLPLRLWGSVIWLNILAFVFSLFFRTRYGFKVQPIWKAPRKAMEGSLQARSLI